MEGQRTIGTVDESKWNWDGRIALVRPPEGFQGCLEEKMKKFENSFNWVGMIALVRLSRFSAIEQYKISFQICKTWMVCGVYFDQFSGMHWSKSMKTLQNARTFWKFKLFGTYLGLGIKHK